MREGSLDAPIRHPLDWHTPEFYDEAKLDEELRRVFDICHGCRRCFNLCDSFPRLFDLIDESESMELDTVDSQDFGPVVDACTLCDMCFLTKCPYVPPHEFNLDFPHLMLRARMVDRKNGKKDFVSEQLVKTDRNGKLAAPVSGLVNWGGKNGAVRSVMQSTCGIHKEAHLPAFTGKPLNKRKQVTTVTRDETAPGKDRKAVVYATCFGNYNKPEMGEALMSILAKNGVQAELAHPKCCGMPLLEQGDVEGVTKNAQIIKQELLPYVRDGYDVIAMVPSCALMLKFEWPLLMPEDEELKELAENTFDSTEYIVALAKDVGLADGLAPLSGGVNMHLACHARAQNMGAKAVEMLKLIPDTDVTPIERCSGHGGTWGIMKENFEVAHKVGKPVARQIIKGDLPHVASECPLAADHILQGIEKIDADKAPDRSYHPVELFAKAYGLMD